MRATLEPETQISRPVEYHSKSGKMAGGAHALRRNTNADWNLPLRRRPLDD